MRVRDCDHKTLEPHPEWNLLKCLGCGVLFSPEHLGFEAEEYTEDSHTLSRGRESSRNVQEGEAPK